jgi:hypothetical protein
MQKTMSTYSGQSVNPLITNKDVILEILLKVDLNIVRTSYGPSHTGVIDLNGTAIFGSDLYGGLTGRVTINEARMISCGTPYTDRVTSYDYHQ